MKLFVGGVLVFSGKTQQQKMHLYHAIAEFQEEAEVMIINLASRRYNRQKGYRIDGVTAIAIDDAVVEAAYKYIKESGSNEQKQIGS